MSTSLAALELLQPRSLREALRMLRDEGGLVPLAGATDLYRALAAGAVPARRFLDLWRLDGLRRIRVRGDRLSIGALATYAALLRSAAVRRQLPMLAADAPPTLPPIVPRLRIWRLPTEAAAAASIGSCRLTAAERRSAA